MSECVGVVSAARQPAALPAREASAQLAPRAEAVACAEVWAFDLNAAVDERVLSAAECERADRFRFERHRRRFRRRRAHLRHLLAAHTGHDPQSLRFVLDEFGKPGLADHRATRFSASSSADVAAIAVSAHEIGIDIEFVRPDLADADVARRLFAPEEASAVLAGSAEDFFRCWTRKEAYVKAIGMGLSFPLDSFAIEVADVPAPRLLRSTLRPADVASSTIASVAGIESGLVTAVVVRRAGAHVIISSTLEA